MKHSLRFLCTTILIFAGLNLSSVWSQEILVAPNGPITLGLGALEDMAFSPDGKYIATASSQGITLWDAQTFDLIKTLGLDMEYSYLKEVLESARDYTTYQGETKCAMYVEGIDTARNIYWKQFNSRKDFLKDFREGKSTPISFSPDSSFITNGTEVWNINDGKLIVTGDQSKYPFSSDEVSLWLEQSPLNTLNNDFRELDLVTKERVAFSGFSGRINTFEIIDKSTNNTIAYGDGLVDDFVFSADGRQLIVTSVYNADSNDACVQVRLYDLLEPKRAVKEFRIFKQGKVKRLAFDPEANYFVVQTSSGSIYLTNTNSQPETSLIIIHDSEGGYTLGDANNWQKTDDYPYNAKLSEGILSVTTLEGESIATIEAPPASSSDFIYSSPRKVRFSPDGKTLGVLWATMSDGKILIPFDTSAVLYDLTNDASSLGTLGHHFAWITSATFSPNNNVIATTGWQAIDLWQVTWDFDAGYRPGQHLRTLNVPGKLVEKVDFSADSSLIATISKNDQILIWQVDTGELIASSHQGADDFALHPDGKSVVFTNGSDLYTWKILEEDANHNRPQIIHKGENSNIYRWGIEFSPDGSLLMFNSGECLILDAESYSLVYSLNPCSNFSPDSKFLVSWYQKPDYTYEFEAYYEYEAFSGGRFPGALLYNLEEKHSSHIPHELQINSLDFSLDGDYLITVGSDGLLFMNTKTQHFMEKLSNFSGGFPPITQAVLTLENNVVTFHINGDVLLWDDLSAPIHFDVSRSKSLLHFKHQKLIFELTTSSDKRTIAARNVDGTVTLFPVGYPNDFK